MLYTAFMHVYMYMQVVTLLKALGTFLSVLRRQSKSTRQIALFYKAYSDSPLFAFSKLRASLGLKPLQVDQQESSESTYSQCALFII